MGRSLETTELDVRDKNAVNELFKKHKFHAVLHLAALKAVGESITIPLEYYKTNVFGTVNLLEVSLFSSHISSSRLPINLKKKIYVIYE